MVLLCHISGKHNISDWGTRMYMLGDWRAWHADHMDQVQPILSCLNRFENSEQTEDILCVECDVTAGGDPKFFLDQVHGGKALHLGTRQTWQKLNKHFPGHMITLKVVDDFVKACPRYQKDRLKMT